MRVQVYCRLLAWVVVLTLPFVSGCKKNKPPVPPVQAQAPTIESLPPQPTPPANATTTTPPTSTTSTTTATSTPPAENPPPPKPKKSTSTHHHSTSTIAKKPAPASTTPTPTTPPPTSPPPANETIAKATPPPSEEAVGQISPEMSKSAASQAQQSTTQLLDSTEKDLHGLTRTLSNDEKNTVTQIRSYITQSRTALKNQDLELAHNLALKAHQLCDQLVKQ